MIENATVDSESPGLTFWRIGFDSAAGFDRYGQQTGSSQSSQRLFLWQKKCRRGTCPKGARQYFWLKKTREIAASISQEIISSHFSLRLRRAVGCAVSWPRPWWACGTWGPTTSCGGSTPLGEGPARGRRSTWSPSESSKLSVSNGQGRPGIQRGRSFRRSVEGLPASSPPSPARRPTTGRWPHLSPSRTPREGEGAGVRTDEERMGF